MEQPGSVLTFRPLEGKVDYPLMLVVAQGSNRADRIGGSATLEDIERVCTPADGYDPTRDVLLALGAGIPGEAPSVIGYSRVGWYSGMEDTRDAMQTLYTPRFSRHEEGKMKTDQTAPKSIDEYIAGFPPDVQEILQKIRMTIRKAAPGAEEAIKYQLPTFTLKGNLVHFGAFKKHIGFYPTPTGTEKFRDELAAYEGAKGSVRFPLDKPIPYDLITEIVKFRVRETLDRAGAKKTK